VNHYDNPTSFTIIANRLESITLDAKSCVPIWNNYLRTPDYDIVAVYAHKLANIDIDIEIASRNLRLTNLIAVPETQRQTWINIIKQREAGEPYIFGHTEMDASAISALDVGANPDSLDKLLIARTKTMNDCMTMLGINNANMDKKERLVTEEVSANDEQVDAMLNIALESRLEAVEQINDMFGLDISVRPSTQAEKSDSPFYDGGVLDENGPMMEVDEDEDNGDVHGND
jgi:hypothetical protein